MFSKAGGISEFTSGWHFPTASNFPFSKLCRVIGIVSLIDWVMGIVWVEVVVVADMGAGTVGVRVAGTIVTFVFGVDIRVVCTGLAISLTLYLLLAGIFVFLFSFLWAVLAIGFTGALVLGCTCV